MTTGQSREPRIQRARLGSELRRLRTLAGLSGADLGRQLEVSQKTISRIEHGDSLPSLPQVTVWARATGAPADRLAVLTGLLEAAVNEVATFRDKLTDGLMAVQLEVRELESSSGTVRNFQTGIIPGLLQTAEYARRVMEMANIRNDANLAAAVAARLERQQALHDKSRDFEFLMTEAALRWRPGPPELLAAQLDHIAALATLDTIDLGVIPMDAEMHAITRCSFILYEDRSDGQPPVVAVETPHASLYASDAADVELYRDQLALFRQSAIHGAEALAFIRAIAHPSNAGFVYKPAKIEVMDPRPTTVQAPIHLQIADDIRMQIERGELSPGDSLPTLAQLCERWSCSMNSARGAINLLKAQGLITAGRGKAPIVRIPPGRVIRSSERHQAEKDQALRA